VTKHVIIVGGGVAGLSAAHELCERGFQVTIYERWGMPGGKARSTWVPRPTPWPSGFMPPLLGLGREPGPDPHHRHELPGEHGFRFISNFYRHLPATLERIPLGHSGKSVLDNLMIAQRVMTTAAGTTPIVYPQNLPRNFHDLEMMFVAMMESSNRLNKAELDNLMKCLWQIATSCSERRLAEYEKISWWDFLDTDHYSAAYKQFADFSRLTVAADPHLTDTRTMGDLALQQLNINLSPIPKDRVFNGPTNLAWLDPWVEYLRGRGVDIQFNARATAIKCSQGQIQHVTICQHDQKQHVSGDYYLFCVPVEVMAQLLAQDVENGPHGPVYHNVLKADPSLATIIELAKYVGWMNGIQYYLKEDVPITSGHVMFIDTPWALTAISQHQFWPHFNFAGRFDKPVRGILSVDISEWNTPGWFHKKPARECTIQEIAEETWCQMKRSINGRGHEILHDEQVVAYHVDTDISSHAIPTSHDKNAEPLLVNQCDTWNLRPGAFTRIPNMFLAADYVRTNTMIATMEAANEAARRATNAILAAERRNDYCKIWQLHEPLVLMPWRLYDTWRYRLGLPWNATPPWFVTAAAQLLILAHKIWRKIHHRKIAAQTEQRSEPRP